MAQEKEYFAFISYQRKDEEWADWLRSKLEHYRLPSSVRQLDASLTKEIRPIFRDALELAGGVLAKEIETALQNSKFLIVICSPNSAKSPWVNKEIQTFIDLGCEDHIIPFIIDGTPFSDIEDTECFPPALRSLKGEKELLGININELGRDAASIKVVARMFGLKFDTLWQRYEREKKRKRWMVTGGALLFAIMSLGIGGYIAHQNRELGAKNKEVAAERDRANSERVRAESANASLLLANDSINRQYALIQQQRNNLLHQNVIIKSKDRSMQENQSRAVAEKIRKLIEDGDLQTAQLLALEILPSQNNSFSRPYIPEAEIALRESLAPFEKEGFKQVSTLKGNENIPSDNLIISELEDVVYFMGRNSVYKHNLQTGEEYQFDNKGIINRFGAVGLLYENPIYLNKEETRLCYVDWTDYIVWDTRSGKIVKKGKIDNTLVDEGNDSLILSSIDRAFVYKEGNAINNNKIKDLPEEIYKRVNDGWATSYLLSKSGNYILVDEKIFSNITDRDLFIKTRTTSMNSTKRPFQRTISILQLETRTKSVGPRTSIIKIQIKTTCTVERF